MIFSSNSKCSIWTVVFLFSTAAIAFGQNSDRMDSLSYSVGIVLAQNLQQQGLTDLDGHWLKEGITDYLSDRDLKVEAEEANQLIQEYFAQKNLNQWEKNVEAEEAFLKKNSEREEVHVLESGVQYEILTEGDGPKPGPSDKVNAHYHGTLIDGKVFDSSVDRGQAATFPVNGVIPGWQEILQLMPVGSKWKVYIPSKHAYGERGAGETIEPYSMLIFEIELLEIE